MWKVNVEQLCVVDVHGKKTEQEFMRIYWAGLFVSEGCRVAAVRRQQELPPC